MHILKLPLVSLSCSMFHGYLYTKPGATMWVTRLVVVLISVLCAAPELGMYRLENAIDPESGADKN